jgi:hypothetical protein
MRIWWLFGLDKQDYRQDQEKLLDAIAVLQKISGSRSDITS